MINNTCVEMRSCVKEEKKEKKLLKVGNEKKGRLLELTVVEIDCFKLLMKLSKEANENKHTYSTPRDEP